MQYTVTGVQEKIQRLVHTLKQILQSEDCSLRNGQELEAQGSQMTFSGSHSK